MVKLTIPRLMLCTAVIGAVLWLAFTSGDRDLQSTSRAPHQATSPEEVHPSDPPQEIHPNLVTFREQQQSKTTRSLAHLLHVLPDMLTLAESDLLLSWLQTSRPSDQRAISKHAYLVNEVLNLLHRQKEKPKNLPDVIMALAQGKGHNDLIRDYALQHLRLVWQWVDPSNETRAKIEETLWQAVDSQHLTRSGTALLALHNLGCEQGPVSESPRAIPDAPFQQRLEALLTDPQQPAASRMTALRIAKERQFETSASQVRDLIKDQTHSLAVRLSAIATLGRIGSSQDRPLLQSLAETPHLAKAAQAALQHLSQ